MYSSWLLWNAVCPGVATLYCGRHLEVPGALLPPLQVSCVQKLSISTRSSTSVVENSPTPNYLLLSLDYDNEHLKKALEKLLLEGVNLYSGLDQSISLYNHYT